MLIKRLQISTQHHPKPCKLQWLNDSGTMKVVSQALISFTLEKYNDEVLCDVLLPMLARDILLGQPWQFDRKVIYDGYLNRYYFIKDGRKITLVPLSSADVFADQLKLEKKKKEFDEEWREKHSEKKNEIEKKKKKRMQVVWLELERLEGQCFQKKPSLYLCTRKDVWSLIITICLCLVCFNLFYRNLRMYSKMKSLEDYLPL